MDSARIAGLLPVITAHMREVGYSDSYVRDLERTARWLVGVTDGCGGWDEAFAAVDDAWASKASRQAARCHIRLVRQCDELGVQVLREGDGCWEPYATLTVNLCDERNQNASFAYVDTNNMPTAPEFLTRNGLVAFTGACGTSGFCAYPLFAFTSEFFEACANDVEEVQ